MARAAQVDMRSTITRAGQSIPIALAPLVAPYRKHGRISVRVERLPQNARFSHGNRNSNGSWSLASDELDNLTYQVAEGTTEHTLAVRIINLSGGETLAVLDLPISLESSAAEDHSAAPESPAQDTEANDLVRSLRQQLAQMKATLATREAELSAAKDRAAGAQADTAHDAEGEMEALRLELQAEFDARLAAVGAQAAADLRRHRENWAQEQAARLATLTANTQHQLSEAAEAAERDKEQALERAREEWQQGEAARTKKLLAEAHESFEAAAAKAATSRDQNREADLAALQERLAQEARQTLAKAEQEWKTAEDARLAAAEAKWRAAADDKLKELKSNGATAQRQETEAALTALRTELERSAKEALAKAEQEWKTAEAARLVAAEAKWRATADDQLKALQSDGETAQRKETENALAALRAELDRSAKESLAKSEQDWKAKEAARLSEAKAAWQASADKAIAEARTANANGRQSEDTAVQNLRAEMKKLRDTLAERDATLTEAGKMAERAERLAGEQLAKAASEWKTAETARLEEARTKWRAEADKLLAEAKAGADSAQVNASSAAQAKLEEQLTALKTELAARDATLSEARAEVEKLGRELAEAKAKPTSPTPEREPASDDGANDLVAKITKLEEALAEREASLNEAQDIIEQQRQAAKSKSQRTRKAEDIGQEERWAAISNELAEARSRYEAAELALAEVRRRTKDEGRIHQELHSTRGALAAREKELADLRAKYVPLDGQAVEGEAEASVPSDAAAPTAPAKSQYSSTFIGSVIAAACVFALLIVFFPTIEAALFPPPPPPPQETPQAAAPAQAEPAPVEHKALLLRDTKLRADPSNTAKAVATVTKGFEVFILETKDKWTRVRLGTDPTAQQGWVLQSSLSEATPTSDSASE